MATRTSKSAEGNPRATRTCICFNPDPSLTLPLPSSLAKKLKESGGILYDDEPDDSLESFVRLGIADGEESDESDSDSDLPNNPSHKNEEDEDEDDGEGKFGIPSNKNRPKPTAEEEAPAPTQSAQRVITPYLAA